MTSMFRPRRGELTSPEGDIMCMIGTEIAKMHKADIIHGDLTTSNMIVRHPTSLKGLQLVRTQGDFNHVAHTHLAHIRYTLGIDRLRTCVHVDSCRRQGRRPIRLGACVCFNAPGVRTTLRIGFECI